MPRVLLLVIARIILAGAASLAFAGCSVISGIGPSAGEVADEAGAEAGPQFELVDLDSRVVETLRHRGPAGFLAHFGDYRPSVEPRIGIGDTVAVTIWEAGAGGLFSAPLVPGSFTSGSKSATIPDQVVGRDGAITVPYAGRIHVAGRTTRDVQTIVEHALQGKAIQPQVLVNVIHSVSNTVTVTGEVANGSLAAYGGLVPLSVKGDRLLTVIAETGGIRAPVNETYVQLSRGAVTARVAMTRVTSNPKENIYMRANDVLTLIRDPQTFIAYGATSKNAEIPFDAEGINLTQALAKAGGLVDAQSNPEGVFVFRFEPEDVMRALRPDSQLIQHGHSTPVVYRLNLREAHSLFVAQSFQMVNRDVLYVSNAPINNLRKVMQIVNLITSPAYTGIVASTDLQR